MAEFEERLTLLTQLRDAWANGKTAIMESVVVNDRGLMCMQRSVVLLDVFQLLVSVALALPTFSR